MLILFAFMLMTGFLLLQMHAMNEIKNENSEEKTKEEEEQPKQLTYELNGVNDALSNYYKVN